MKNLFMIICFSLLTIGCKETKDSRMLGDENAGKTLIGWYYYNLGEERYANLHTYLDTELFSSSKEADLMNKLKERQAEYGVVEKAVFKDFSLINEDKKNKTKEYEFTYDVQYKLKPAIEKFLVVKRGNEMKIAKIDF